MKNRIFRGIPASPSIAIGRIKLFKRKEDSSSDKKKDIDIKEEIKLFEDARRKSLKQLRKLKTDIKGNSNGIPSRLVDFQILLLQDPLFLNNVEKRITNGESASQSISNFIKSIEQDFNNIPDSYISERYLDVRDAMSRLMKNLGEEEEEMNLSGNEHVIVANHLSPTDTLQIDRNKINGIITETGGETSHTAIIAEALNIPAVVGIEKITDNIKEGEEIIVDGINGLIIVNPDEKTKRRYEEKEKESEKIREKFLKEKDLPSKTIDGYSIDISANIELPLEINSINKYGAEGVGLLRTEFIYLQSDELPDEDNQFNFYSKVASISLPDYVIIRTLDIGGDKLLKIGLPEETNPALGWRGIRLSMGNTSIFKTQLRAILRASSSGNIRILLPMISQIEEVKKFKAILEEVKDELRKQKIEFDEDIEVGIMVEVPSVSLMTDCFAKNVDFFSIGTNDLTQYTLAVDRGNKRVSSIYDHLDPSIIKLMKMTVEKAHQRKKWVGVCGKIAADPVAVPVLIGLGVDELSLTPAFIPEIKNIIRGISKKESIDLLNHVLKLETSKEIRSFLEKELLQRFPSLKSILVEVEND